MENKFSRNFRENSEKHGLHIFKRCVACVLYFSHYFPLFTQVCYLIFLPPFYDKSVSPVSLRASKWI